MLQANHNNSEISLKSSPAQGRNLMTFHFPKKQVFVNGDVDVDQDTFHQRQIFDGELNACLKSSY